MRKQLLAGAMTLALVMGMTTSAMAFSYGGRGVSGFHSGRFEGVRGFSGWRHGDWGSRQLGGGHGPTNDGYGAGRARFGSGFGPGPDTGR
jgi:hypothetical protein